MDKYQALETLYVMRGVAAQDAMNFFTLLSAYLIVAYIAGSKLTAFQVWAISILYSVFSLGPIAGFYVGVLDMKLIEYGNPVLQTEFPMLVPVIMGLAWAISIYFMYNVRKTKL
jgi:hypothetical protein